MRCQRRSCKAVCECVVYPYFCCRSAASCKASAWHMSVAEDGGVRLLSRHVVYALRIRGSARVRSGVCRYRDPKSSGSAGDASGAGRSKVGRLTGVMTEQPRGLFR